MWSGINYGGGNGEEKAIPLLLNLVMVRMEVEGLETSKRGFFRFLSESIKNRGSTSRFEEIIYCRCSHSMHLEVTTLEYSEKTMKLITMQGIEGTEIVNLMSISKK